MKKASNIWVRRGLLLHRLHGQELALALLLKQKPSCLLHNLLVPFEKEIRFDRKKIGKPQENFVEDLWPQDDSCSHLFAAFRNFHISICSQIVDKLRLTRYYKGKSNTRQGGATMTAVIYARYSSDSQREASIEGQLRDCKDYAEKNGITVVGTYIDRAYSAKTDDRPDFQRMIKDSGKKIFDVVLVWKLDRFARNRFDAVNYKYQLEKNGVHLVSAMEPISQGPEGIMVESMLIGMAEYYSAELAPESGAR